MFFIIGARVYLFILPHSFLKKQKISKKVLTNLQKYGIIIIENKKRGNPNEEIKCDN